MSNPVVSIRANPHPEPTIVVEIRDQFGNRTVRPICETAKTLASIAGTTTLTAHTLRQVEKLGYRIVIESGGSGRGYDFLRSFIGARS